MEQECSVESKVIKEDEVKRVRRRRKKIHQTIRKQMEFYFSDANLTKDRYLSKLIEDDPYVDLSVFLKFNKIRELTDSVQELANVLSKSEFLTLSDDRTKICRPTPVNRNYSEDECSIYVQNIPPDAKHEWLQEMFTAYGKVVYVSLPKYKQNGKLKGFGFVEFESPEGASKALEAFSAAGCCLPTDMAPEKLCSVATFEPCEGKMQVGIVENQGEGEMENIEGNGDGANVKEETGEEDLAGVDVKEEEDVPAENISPHTKERRKKRKKRGEGTEEDAENEEDVEVKIENLETEKCSSPVSKKKKKLKKEEEEEQAEEGKGPEETSKDLAVAEEDTLAGSKEKKKRKRKREGSDEEDIKAEEGEGEEEEDNIGTHPLEDESSPQKEKKKGKRKKEEIEEDEQEEEGEAAKKIRLNEEPSAEMETAEKMSEVKKKRKKRNRNKSGKLEEEPLGLRILSKRDWKRLRNKYLNLQRKNMRALRTQMMGRRWCDYWCDSDDHQNMQHENDWNDSKEKASEYNQESSTKNSEAPAEKSKPRIQFSAGVIVKVQFKEPLESAKKFKDEVRNLPKSDAIAYVDVKDASSTAYIRCQTAEAAIDLLKDIPWENRKILEGNEENDYWEKIIKDRHEKITKKIRVNQRGRDKILKKAENLMGKHVRYEN